MKSSYYYIIFALLNLTVCAASGQTFDSTFHKTRQNVIVKFNRNDSLSNKINNYRTNAVLTIDSLKALEAAQIKDSLKRLNLPFAAYQHKLDSLTLNLKQPKGERHASLNFQNTAQYKTDSLRNELLRKQKAVQQSIQSKTSITDSLSMKLRNPVTGKELYSREGGIDQTTNISNVPLSGKDTPIQSAGGNLNNIIPDTNSGAKDFAAPTLDTSSGSKNVGRELSTLEQIPKKELSSVNVTKDLGAIGKETKEINTVAGKAEAYVKDAKNINANDIKKAEEVSKDIEKEAVKRTELQGLDKNIKEAEAAKNVLTEYQEALKKMDPKNADKLLKKAGVDPVPDQFVQQQAALQAGIKQLEKLKRKYGSIPDSRYLPKHPPSDMKGKPLIERLVPGLNFQFFQQGGLTMADISPFVMYRFTSRWRAGLGGTYRLQFNNKVQSVHPHDAFGGRLMMDYKIISGFNVHGEGEWMKMVPYNPATGVKSNDSEKKQWIPCLYLGVLKQYKVSPTVSGNFQVLYNFLYERNGVYPNRINIRFGFEIKLRKKKEKSPDVKK